MLWCTATSALSHHGHTNFTPTLDKMPVVSGAVQGRPASRRPATPAPETAAAGRAVAARVWQGKGILARPLGAIARLLVACTMLAALRML